MKHILLKFYLKPIAQKYGIPGFCYILLLPIAFLNANFNNSVIYYHIKSSSKYILNKIQKNGLLDGDSFTHASNVSKKVQFEKLLINCISENFSHYNQNEIDDLIIQLSNFYKVND